MNIKELRDKLGLTRFELARRVGVSSNTIAAWEAGVTKPKAVNEEKLKKALKG